MAVVFAQLIVGGEERGVHALLVPIRDEDGDALPGVRLEDCGAKLGLNGVDNGRIWFDHVRVPRENLLDRYAQVARGRHVLQPDREPDQALLHDDRHADPGPHQRLRRVDQRDQGRADDRRPPRARAAPVRPAGRDEEALLMDYRTHQRRLLPALAKTYALSFAQERLVDQLHEVFTQRGRRPQRGASSRRSRRA